MIRVRICSQPDRLRLIDKIEGPGPSFGLLTVTKDEAADLILALQEAQKHDDYHKMVYVTAKKGEVKVDKT